MLSLKNIVKDYATGDNAVRALNDVSLDFRENEFVSILGPSGCGKTTLLNIVGGLDQYTSGDLIIDGISTKKYNDGDWDTYRNHSIGFVFQNYNLIPHQSVLSNVELALTLSGISKSERRARAIEALRQVGLEDQIHKRPNQMSGGQMQRVAIARALVNDPEIILADEPTGALDTQTSEQIMQILHQISENKLIIMVTHNPDLAERYSSRIIRFVDGRVVGDTNPYVQQEPVAEGEAEAEECSKKTRRVNPFSINSKRVKREQTLLELEKRQKEEKAGKKKPGKKRSMSFFTAISLSLNNLMTKKGRTFLTSFAGSIGIIGIALILSVSTGVNNYINTVQRDTLASYPISIDAESVDMTALVTALMGANEAKHEHELDKVYESAVIAELFNTLNSAETSKNDLKAFKKYLDNTEAFKQYATAIRYTYDFQWQMLTKDTEGTVIKSDVTELISAMYGGGDSSTVGGAMMNNSPSNSTFNVWEELLVGTDGEMVNDLIKEEYDLLYGQWPTAYNEIVLVVNKNNEISDLALYALGLRTQKEITDAMMGAVKGELMDTTDIRSYSYEEMCNMDFRLVLAADSYQKQPDGTYYDRTETQAGMKFLYDTPGMHIPLKVTAIIRPNEDATSAVINGNIAYTAALTDYVIERTGKSALLNEQLNNPHMDVLTGLPFMDENYQEPSDMEKKTAVLAYIDSLSITEKAALYTTLAGTPSKEEVNAYVNEYMSNLTPQAIQKMLAEGLTIQMNISYEEAAAYVAMFSEEQRDEYARTAIATKYEEEYRKAVESSLSKLPVEQLCAQFDALLNGMTLRQYTELYKNHLPAQYSENTYEDNLELLGYVDKESPSNIKLYAATFENKDAIADLITEYNKTVNEDQAISYTDYVALLMASVTTIVNAISYVLIAFVAISLVVSSIMIGIITYISVLERTKEIGILRSIGASKKDIRRVFNAETMIVGFVAGAIGILMTLGFNVVINIILYRLTDIASLKATLPVMGAIVLVAISVGLTLIAGLFPAGFAAKRNPVEALRSE